MMTVEKGDWKSWVYSLLEGRLKEKGFAREGAAHGLAEGRT